MAQATLSASRRQRSDDSNLGKHCMPPSWYDWPYCLERLSDGAWLALNRDYKPLGERTNRWVEYEGHPARVRLPGLTTALAFMLDWEPWFDEAGELSRVYLHDDATSPRKSPLHRAAYLEKLKMVLELGVELPEPRRVERPATPIENEIRAAARKRPQRRMARPIWKRLTRHDRD
jgi:hypothetical protein